MRIAFGPASIDLFFAAVVALVGLQRILELRYARKTSAALLAAGARAVRPDGYGGLLAVHALWFAGLVLEGLLRPAHLVAPAWLATLFLVLFLGGSALRYACMVALGPRWSTRVFVLPSAPLVTRGPYRLLKHPIYLGVAVELAALPLAFGLYSTALLVGIVHLFALRNRIRIEEDALKDAPKDALDVNAPPSTVASANSSRSGPEPMSGPTSLADKP